MLSRGIVPLVPGPASEDYVREKLRNAAETVRDQEVPLQVRLHAALTGALGHLSAEDFHESRERLLFAEIYYRCTDREALGDEGDYAATVLNMTQEEAELVVGEVLELADLLGV
jgi:hypothetical protein